MTACVSARAGSDCGRSDCGQPQSLWAVTQVAPVGCHKKRVATTIVCMLRACSSTGQDELLQFHITSPCVLVRTCTRGLFAPPVCSTSRWLPARHVASIVQCADVAPGTTVAVAGTVWDPATMSPAAAIAATGQARSMCDIGSLLVPFSFPPDASPHPCHVLLSVPFCMQ